MKSLLHVLVVLVYSSAWCKCIRVGTAQPYATIHKALQAALPHDTIIVTAGRYYEQNLTIAKPLILIGESLPVLDGQGKYQILTVTASHVTITGFEFTNTGVSSIKDLAGLEAIAADYLHVYQNRFIDTYFAIHVSNTKGCVIENNYLKAAVKKEYQSGNGIHLWQCSGAVIRNNYITRHRDGIYFEFVTQSVIERNESNSNQRYGLHFMFSHQDEYRFNTFKMNGAGVAVMYSHSVVMERNSFEQNEGNSVFGLLLKDMNDSKVMNNTFTRNTVAAYLEGVNRTQFIGNNFIQNGYAIRLQANCDGNTFTCNNFFQNTFDLATNGTLVLKKINGNYWDKYQGYDLNKDQLGDIPHHPVNLYAMVVERVPAAMFLWRSFTVFLLDRAEKAFPAITPENLKDINPRMRPYDSSSGT